MTFLAHFGLRGTRVWQQLKVGVDVAQVTGHSESVSNDGTTALVTMTFKHGLWVRMTPAFSDESVLDPDEFDDSLIPYAASEQDPEKWLEDFGSLWLKSGNCPDPGVYIVEQSNWNPSGLHNDFTHYLIEGHDSYVEVLAKGISWEGQPSERTS